MALAAGEYVENGFVKDADGALVTGSPGVYIANGLLRDADGRLVTTTSTAGAINSGGVLVAPDGAAVVASA